tara:strand:- start:239 stop:1114 length:876 start_codon:yes stop_codon:yes gene_type:complete
MIYNSYQAAEIMGVNVSTIKRWTDLGKLNCRKTEGGHRKFHLNDLKGFIQKNKKISSDVNLKHLIGANKSLTDAINNQNNSTLINHCFKSLISDNANKFPALNNALLLKGYSLDMLFDEIIIPALIKIGQKWVENKLSITEEHLATERIKRFIFNLTSNSKTTKTTFNAFCFTLLDDQHDLPTYMAESLIKENKYIKVFNLGANLPINDFIDLTKKVPPKIIFISIVYSKKMALITKEINLLCKTLNNSDVKIFLSGKATHDISITHKNLIYIKSFKELKDQILNINNNEN